MCVYVCVCGGVCNLWVCVSMGFVMCGWCMCGFFNEWVCVCLRFVMCVCVYVLVF